MEKKTAIAVILEEYLLDVCMCLLVKFSDISYSPQRAIRKMIPKGKSLSHTAKYQLIKNLTQFNKPGINVGIVDSTDKAQKHLEHLEMAVIVKNCSDLVKLYMSTSASFFVSFSIKLIYVWLRYLIHSCSIEHRTSLFLDFPFQVASIVLTFGM